MSKIDCSLVMYADASIRFRQTFPKFVLSKQDVLDINLYFIHAPQREWTHPDMYKWFSRSPSKCTLQQYQSGSILFRPESPLWRQVFSLWRKCAQFKQCLLPDGAHIRGSNPNGSEYKAHRDDQSALNFALANVVGDEEFKNFGTLWSHIEAKREHRVPFRKWQKRAQCWRQFHLEQAPHASLLDRNWKLVVPFNKKVVCYLHSLPQLPLWNLSALVEYLIREADGIHGPYIWQYNVMFLQNEKGHFFTMMPLFNHRSTYLGFSSSRFGGILGKPPSNPSPLPQKM